MNERARSNLIWMGMAVGVLLLTAAFRLLLLQHVPPGLAQDEVLDAGIPAYILDGNVDLFFRQGYGHEPLYHYWSIPFYLIFGESVLTARLPVAFLGMLLVALTLRWGKAWFGRTTAVVAGVGLAISWWPIIFSRVGIRPIMEPVLLVAAAICWRRRPWLAGVLLGLSFYTYTGARVVLAIPLLHAALLWLQSRFSRSEIDYAAAMRRSLLIFAVAVVVAAPMQITLWQDPTLQQRIDQLAGPLAALRSGDPGPVWTSTLATLGVFSVTGDPRWTYSLPGRPLFDWFTALFFYGGLLLALWRLRRPRYTLLLVWLGVTLLPSALTPQAPSTVRLVGAMPVVYLLPGLAVTAVFRIPYSVFRIPWRDYRLPITDYRLLLVFLLFVVNVTRTVRDGFVRWPNATETRVEHYQPVLADMAEHWRQHPGDSMVVADSFFETIDAESLRFTMGQDVGARWVQAGPEQAGAVVFPATKDGAEGRLYVPEFVSLPWRLLAVSGISTEPLYRSPDRPSFAVYALPDGPQEITLLSQPVTFEERITLLGYDWWPPEGERPLQLVTFWRVEATLPWNLTAFVHLLAEDGALLTQHDGLDAAPEQLHPGDTFVQYHPLPMPDDISTELFTLQLGLYTPHNGQRWRHPGTPPDRIILVEESFFDVK